IIVSGTTAELPLPGLEERTGGMVDRIGTFRVFTYYKHGVSQLAVCDLGDGGRVILRMGVAKNRIDICFRSSARCGGCSLAFLISDAVRSASLHAIDRRTRAWPGQESGTGARRRGS